MRITTIRRSECGQLPCHRDDGSVGGVSHLIRVTVLASLLLGLLAPSSGAHAHSGGPTIVPVLDGVTVDVPEEVDVRIVASQAAPLLAVTNPTDEVLEVRSRDGRAWLRISGAGVEVNPAVADTYSTTSPEGGPVPDDVRAGDRPDAWTRVSTAPTWAWFEHRLHPQGLVVPPEIATVDAEQDIAEWQVEVAYGQQEGRLEGRIVHRPPTGTVVSQLTGDVPDTITANALSGSVPAIFMGLQGAEEVLVLGADDEPFLRFTGEGVEGNVRSPSFSTDVTARGEAPLTDTDPTAPPEWMPVASVPRHAWLEGRARPVLDLPQDIIVSTSRVELSRWEVPLLVDGQEAVLTGTTSWLPAGQSVLDEPEGGGVPLLPLAGMVVLAAVGALELLRRRGRAR